MNVNRRAFLVLGGFGALAAYALNTQKWRATEAMTRVLGDVPKTLGSDRLHVQARTILDQFATARSGQLMAMYQTFWPFALENVANLSAINEVCAATEVQKYPARHRVTALPAVACLHALPTLARHERDWASEVLLKTHSAALDTAPHREILEIIWQNTVASIIKNRENWNKIELDPKFLDQGFDLCTRFLRGEENLINPATYAFHALLTYRNAVADRKDESRLKQVNNTLAKIVDTPSGRSRFWFEELHRIMQQTKSTFDGATPQLLEVWMSAGRHPGKLYEYALLKILYTGHLTTAVAHGTAKSAYEQRERSIEASRIFLTLISDYGVTPETWSAIKHKAEILMPEEAVRSLDEIFLNFDNTIKTLVDDRSEGSVASRLSALTPFRKHDYQTITEAAFPADARELLRENAFVYGPGLAGLVKASEPIIRQLTPPHDHQKLHADTICGMLEKEISTDVLEVPLQAYEEIRGSSSSSIRGAREHPRERVAARTPETRESMMSRIDHLLRRYPNMFARPDEAKMRANAEAMKAANPDMSDDAPPDVIDPDGILERRRQEFLASGNWVKGKGDG